MKLIHQYPGTPLLWIAENSRGQMFLFRQVHRTTRARLRISSAYADAIRDDRAKAERVLALCLIT